MGSPQWCAAGGALLSMAGVPLLTRHSVQGRRPCRQPPTRAIVQAPPRRSVRAAWLSLTRRRARSGAVGVSPFGVSPFVGDPVLAEGKAITCAASSAGCLRFRSMSRDHGTGTSELRPLSSLTRVAGQPAASVVAAKDLNDRAVVQPGLVQTRGPSSSRAVGLVARIRGRRQYSVVRATAPARAPCSRAAAYLSARYRFSGAGVL